MDRELNNETHKKAHAEVHEEAHRAAYKESHKEADKGILEEARAAEKPLVSVIVPVYNRSKTIARCADSILAQTYQNLEIIFVNDGSRDDSFSQLLEYAKRDKRIVLINKPNSGVSDSRNYALESAHGEYVQFVDSDDWIPENATETYVNAALLSGSDLVVADYYRVRGKQVHQSGDTRAEGHYTRTEYAELMMDRAGDFYYGVVWNKLFRRRIIEENALNFDEKLDWCEDFLFNLEYLKYASRITVIRKPLYFYVKTKGSLVNTKTTPANVILTKLTLYEYYKELYQSLDLYEDNKLRIQSFLLQAAGDKNKRVDPETYGMLAEKYLLKETDDASDQEKKEKREKTAFRTQAIIERFRELSLRLQELTAEDADDIGLMELWEELTEERRAARESQKTEQRQQRREQRERQLEMLNQLLLQQNRKSASGKKNDLNSKADRGGAE